MDDWEFFEKQFECPVCGNERCVPPIGNKNAKILIVAEFPGEEELKRGIPMVGPMSRILRTEIGRLGLDWKSTRRCNLWQHPPNNNKDCLDEGIRTVILEAKNKKAILLLGDDVLKTFTDHESIMAVSGLQVHSRYFSAPIIIACPNPAMLFHKGRGVGEVRLALTKFINEVNDQKKIEELGYG